MSSRIPPKQPAPAPQAPSTDTIDKVLHAVPALGGAITNANAKVQEAEAVSEALRGTELRAPDTGTIAKVTRAWGAFVQRNARVVDLAGKLGGAANIITGGRAVVINGKKTLNALGQALFAARRGYRDEAQAQLLTAADDAFLSVRGGVTAGRGAIAIHNIGVARAGAKAAVEAFRVSDGFKGLRPRVAREVEAMVANAGAVIAQAKSQEAVAKTLINRNAARSVAAAVEVGQRSVTEAVLHANAMRPASEVASRTIGAAEALAGDAALRAGSRAGATAIGKAAARFAPGLNVAMAVVDTGVAGRDILLAVKNPTGRNIGRAIMAGLTAAGSIISATNIPVISQLGAAASTVTGVITALL
jgi:hypothetical protein